MIMKKKKCQSTSSTTTITSEKQKKLDAKLNQVSLSYFDENGDEYEDEDEEIICCLCGGESKSGGPHSQCLSDLYGV